MKELLLLALGIYIGFVCGLGSSFGRLEEAVRHGAVINGDVTIRHNGRPLTMSNLHINANGAEYTITVAK